MIGNKIRLIELFAGIGSQAMALRDLCTANGLNPDEVFETHRVVEFDKYPVKSYNAVHGTDIVPTDITQISGEDLGIVDTDKYTYIMTYSFPCFTGDTLVNTRDGLKEIKDVKVGDFVLGHDNKYHRVLDSKYTGEKNIFTIKCSVADEINCTDNHKFYVRKYSNRFRTDEDGKKVRFRDYDAPVWMTTKELMEAKNSGTKYYLGVAINQNEIIPDWDGIDFQWSDGRKDRHKNQLTSLFLNHSFWWVIGRYLGDGWARTQGGIIICCDKKEVAEITPHLRNCGFNYTVSDERTTAKIHVALKELESFTEQFGKGANNKHIPGFMFDLPREYLKSFLDGYTSADGYCEENYKYGITTISRELAYGIGQIIAKAYQRPYSIYKVDVPETKVIEGRTVNQNPFYQIKWKMKDNPRDQSFYEYVYIIILNHHSGNRRESVSGGLLKRSI